LLKHEYLQRLDDGRYQIGPAPFLLGALYQRSLRVGDIVLPLMAKLAQQTGESASFYVIHENARICLHRIDSKHEIRDHVREGDAFPLSQGSGGGVLSAFSGMRGARYDQIRADYFYISRGQRDSDTAGISSPVFGAGQRSVGSLTISGPRSRIDDKLEKTCLPLLKAAAHATRALGGDARPLEEAAAKVAGQNTASRRTPK
jgi:DNA-binding IclR family transcriptional regulator